MPKLSIKAGWPNTWCSATIVSNVTYHPNLEQEMVWLIWNLVFSQQTNKPEKYNSYYGTHTPILVYIGDNKAAKPILKKIGFTLLGKFPHYGHYGMKAIEKKSFVEIMIFDVNPITEKTVSEFHKKYEHHLKDYSGNVALS